MAEETYPINIWINEERYAKLQEAGLADMAKEKLAGMKVLELRATPEQKDEILRRFPMAKFDASTTKSIELLPREVKDKMLEVAIQKKSVGPDAIEEFLRIEEFSKKYAS